MKKQNRIIIFLFAIIGVFIILSNACKKDEEYLPQMPVVETVWVIVKSATTADASGMVTSMIITEEEAITATGVCWGTMQTPTITDNITLSAEGEGGSNYICHIKGLIPNTTYFFRAYATNSFGTGYGIVMSFTTLSPISNGTVTDIDGNVYNTIGIGSQEWMVENLKTTKYSNGSAIPIVTDNSQWSNLSTGAYCNYGNDTNIAKTYGKLYNWYAASDTRNICPTGWHVPSDYEWGALVSNFEGEEVAGGKLKEAGTAHWNSPNTGADNSSGFYALPGGSRYSSGDYGSIGYFGVWWSSTEVDVTNAWNHYLSYGSVRTFRNYGFKKDGFSVRCVK